MPAYRNPENWISETGRKPATAIPIDAATIPASDSGVSITLFSPNFFCNPSVTLKTPPFLPTSSPRTTTFLSLFISWNNARLIASTIVRSISLQPLQILKLLPQLLRHLFIHILEHIINRAGFVILILAHCLFNQLFVLLQDRSSLLNQAHLEPLKPFNGISLFPVFNLFL